MRNIFLEKSFTKSSVETIPGPFSKISKLRISLGRKSKVLYGLPLLFVEGYRKTLNLSCRPLVMRCAIWYQSLFDVCMIVRTSEFPVVSIRLYELAWHSNGSIKCQTLERHSNR